MQRALLESSVVDLPSSYRPSSYFSKHGGNQLLSSETIQVDEFESHRPHQYDSGQIKESRVKALKPQLVASLMGSDTLNFQTEMGTSGVEANLKSDYMSGKDYETNIIKKVNLDEMDMKTLLESQLDKAPLEAEPAPASRFREYQSTRRPGKLSQIPEENETFSNTFVTVEERESMRRAGEASFKESVYRDSRALLKSIKQSQKFEQRLSGRSRKNFIEENVQKVMQMKSKPAPMDPESDARDMERRFKKKAKQAESHKWRQMERLAERVAEVVARAERRQGDSERRRLLRGVREFWKRIRLGAVRESEGRREHSNRSFYEDFKNQKLESKCSMEIEFLESEDLGPSRRRSTRLGRMTEEETSLQRETPFALEVLLKRGSQRNEPKPQKKATRKKKRKKEPSKPNRQFPRRANAMSNFQKFDPHHESIRKIKHNRSKRRRQIKGIEPGRDESPRQSQFWRHGAAPREARESESAQDGEFVKHLKKERNEKEVRQLLRVKFSQLRREPWRNRLRELEFEQKLKESKLPGQSGGDSGCSKGDSASEGGSAGSDRYMMSLGKYFNKNQADASGRLINIDDKRGKSKDSKIKLRRRRVPQKHSKGTGRTGRNRSQSRHSRNPSIFSKNSRSRSRPTRSPNRSFREKRRSIKRAVRGPLKTTGGSGARDKSPGFDRDSPALPQKYSFFGLKDSDNDQFSTKTPKMMNKHRHGPKRGQAQRPSPRANRLSKKQLSSLQISKYQAKRRQFEALKSRMLQDHQRAVSRKTTDNLRKLRSRSRSVRRSTSKSRSGRSHRSKSKNSWKYSPLSQNLWNAMPSRSPSANNHYSSRGNHSPMILRKSFQIDRDRNRSASSRSERLFFLHQRKLKMREKKRLQLEAEALNRELQECSFQPRINSSFRTHVDSEVAVEDRLQSWKRRRERKYEQIRHVKDVSVLLQAERKICDCFDPLNTRDRRKILELEGIGQDAHSQLKSEISLEHRSDCSARLSRKGSVREDNFIIENKKTSESIAKFLYQKEFARKEREKKRKLNEQFVKLRSYLKH